MDVLNYRDMAADATRVEAFRRAIEAAVRPGDVVVDVGSGLGTYAVFACRAGARKVYAIERESIIVTAREVARASGCAGRIEFIRGDAFGVHLPERADVAVLEDFSAAFVESETERLIRHVVTRLLRRGGRVVPRRVDICAAPVSCPRLYARIDSLGDDAYGVDFSAVRTMTMNCVQRARLGRADLLARPARVHRIMLDGAAEFPFRARRRFRAMRSGPVHGIAVWFEADLAHSVRLSNAPGAPPTLWGQGFLPLVRPLRARRGAAVTLDLAASFSRDSDRVWWRWEVGSGGERADGTTFRGMPLSTGEIEAGSRRHRPGLSADGAVTEFVLQSMRAGGTIREVAAALRRRFPRRFPSSRDALVRAVAEARRSGRPPCEDARP